MKFSPPGFASATADYRFLTYRKADGTTTSKVADKCRKISDTFFVIRENDTKGGGYHYHAILSIKKGIKDPPKSWFTKGVHINLKKIGRPQTNEGMILPSSDLSFREANDWLLICPEDRPQTEERLIEQALVRHIKRTNRLKNVERVLQYMSKEYQDRPPILYEEYVYVHNGKTSTLPP